MNTVFPRKSPLNMSFLSNGISNQRGKIFGIMIIGALLSFELFNYSTTEFALADVLGELSFAGIRWATILSIAFCGIDFAGIARIFTPEQGADEPAEVWYLFAAWVLAAGMNATLTWWGVSVAIAGHQSQGSLIFGSDTVRTVVPIFVAVMVWVIRLLIIGTFSVAGDRLFSQETKPVRKQNTAQQTPLTRPAPATFSQRPARPVSNVPLTPASALRPAPKPNAQASYHSLNNRPQQSDPYYD
jgi:hypothetical protein